MASFVSVVVNALFLAVLGISLMNAWFWGEMAGIPAGGDKSGLGGLMAVMLFLIASWCGVAVLLIIAVVRGGLDGLPQGLWARLALVLGAHLALGAVSAYGFSSVSEGLMHDNMGPQRLSWFFGIVLPLPALLVAWWGINPGTAARSPRLALVPAAAVIVLHALCFRSNLQDMRRRHAAKSVTPAADAASTTAPSD